MDTIVELNVDESVQIDSKPIAGTAEAKVYKNFEHRLIEGIRPIAEHYLATCLHHIFTTGIYDELASHDEAISIMHVADTLNMDVQRLSGLLLFLANEGVVSVVEDNVSLTEKGYQYGEFKAWYTIMIGGYATTVDQIGSALFKGNDFCSRAGRYVGLGSCEMSRYDGMPITKTLLKRSHLACKEILDLGCGNALYLVDFCRNMPGIKAWGVEPNAGGYDEACQLVKKHGMEGSISLHHASSIEFLKQVPSDCNPDLIVFGFVLHEILAQENKAAIIKLLKALTNKFNEINIIVIEVINEIDNPNYMQHGLAKNFWNPYYLLHYFTRQKLEKKKFWESLFKSAGLKIVDLITTDPNVDSSGLELGYLLRKAS